VRQAQARASWLALVVIALLAAERIASAAPVRLDYRAGAGCPDQESFLTNVATRTTELRLSATGTRSWTVTTAHDARGIVTGRLAIHDKDGGETVRDVDGDTCLEVVSARALVAALTVETEAPERGPAAPEQDARPREARGLGIQIGGGANTGVQSGAMPTNALSVAGFIEGRARREGLVSPTVRAGIVRSLTSTTSLSQTGSATFSLTMGTLDLCPSRLTKGDLAVVACARGELGILHGQGSAIAPAREQAPPWLAIDGVVRAEIALVGPLFLEVEGGARAPLLRTRYVFQPDITVWRPTALGWIAAAGAALRFP
jgi:hypothetical protein